jgi:hypothetical protein
VKIDVQKRFERIVEILIADLQKETLKIATNFSDAKRLIDLLHRLGLGGKVVHSIFLY